MASARNARVNFNLNLGKKSEATFFTVTRIDILEITTIYINSVYFNYIYLIFLFCGRFYDSI
jgi:hypothetical protein